MEKQLALFEFYEPSKKPFRGLLSIPHAGQIIPKEFFSWLTEDKRSRDQDIDFEVHKLIHPKRLLERGIFILKSSIHRVACDLNRSAEQAILNWHQNSMGVSLVKEFPSEKQLSSLVATYYKPYFKTIKETLQNHGQKKTFSMIDLHSMPSKPTAYHLEKNPSQGLDRPDFCLSDLSGRSCSKSYMEKAQKNFQSPGILVMVNQPYTGGYLTQFANSLVSDNIQVEIKRGLYMDEQKGRLFPETKLAPFRDSLTEALLRQFLGV